MSPSRIFILRPVGTSLLMLAILLVGIVAYGFLPLSALPEVDYPTIQVQTFYPGASPEVMTSAITAPLEVQFGQMPGLNQMSSTSSGGASVITLQFSLNLSIDIAEQEVQAAINAAGNLLPSDLPAPPIYAKVNPADAPILTLGIVSKTLPLTQLEDLADTRLAQKISQLEGVGLVSVSGGQRPAVRVVANVLALAAYGLNIDDLRTTISNANVNSPKGTLDGPARSWTLNANDQIDSADDYKSIIVAYKNGSPVRLSDVADVRQGAENTYLAGWVNNAPGIILNVQRQPGANVIQVVDRVKQLLPELSSSLPSAAEVSILTDRTNTIRASVHDVEFELTLAVILVVLVIFLFLRNVAGHRHSEPVGAAVAGRHVRGHVPPGFQPEQPVADGADHRHRFRGRRRHRHDREHLALRRAGHGAARGGAEGRGRDRLHHRVADRLADRGADPAPLHGRRGRPAVPRIRHHARRDHPHLGGRLADPRAHDVRQAPAASRRRRQETGIARWSNETFQALIDRYGQALNWVLDRQPLTLIVAVGDARPDRPPLRLHPQGLLPGAGHGPHPGHHRGAAVGLLWRHGAAPGRHWPPRS